MQFHQPQHIVARLPMSGDGSLIGIRRAEIGLPFLIAQILCFGDAFLKVIDNLF